MARTLVVGDIHGCLAELEALFAKVGLGEGDRVYSLGDVVARGPDPAGVLRLLRGVGAQMVRGNHEEKLVRWRRAMRAGERPEPLSGTHRESARSLDDEGWAMIESAPYHIELPEHQVRLVHAGVVPGLPIEAHEPQVLMTIRSLDDEGEPLEQGGPVPWGSRYRGPPHIIYGHHAQPRPQLHPDATGVDTGCVYGGSLTAVLLAEDATMPPLCDRESVLVSVPARRRYFQGK